MAAASFNFSAPLSTRPITPTRSTHGCSWSSSSTKPPVAGGLSLRGHFYSVREGTLSKSFNRANHGLKRYKSSKRCPLFSNIKTEQEHGRREVDPLAQDSSQARIDPPTG